MSPAKEKEEKKDRNLVIELKITVPPLIDANFSETFNHLRKAAEELLKVGRSFVEQDEKPAKKLKKIEIK